MTKPTEVAFPTSSAANSRLQGLDGLRAIACLMVFGVHFGQISRLAGSLGPFDLSRFLANGNTGVALFFSLSGFLLSLPFWTSLFTHANYPRTFSFLLRRAARILPAYFACLTFLIIVNKYWREAGWRHDVLMHFLLIFNYEDKTIFSINPPFWTLAVESQFYLVLPLLFLCVRKLNPRSGFFFIVVTGAAAYLANFIVSQAAVETQIQIGAPSVQNNLNPVLTYSLLAHLPHFLLGVASGWIFTDRKRHRYGSQINDVLVWLSAVAILIILATPLDDLLKIPFGRYNLPFVPLLICTIIVLAPETRLPRAILNSAPIRGIGAVSYGVYIYHLPIQHFVARSMKHLAMNPERDWMVFGTVSLVLSLLIATFSYWLFEKPVLKLVKGSSVSSHQTLPA